MSPSRHAPAPQSDRAFIHVLGIAQICSWGSLYYSFPLIADAMGAELGWSKLELYGALSLGLALSGLVAYPVGAAIDRGHGRLVMTLGSLAAGVLMIAWSQLSSLWLFYLVFAGIGCLHAATLYEPAFAVVARRVGAHRARPGITALTLWGGFASTVFVPFVQVLLDSVGWRGAILALAAVNILLCAGLYATVIKPGRDAPTPAPAPRAAGDARPAVASILRTPAFWALAVAFVAFGAAISAFTFHLYPLLLERGMSSRSAVAAIAVIGPAQVLGRIAIWRLAPQAPIRRIGSVVVLVLPVAFLGFALLPPDLVAIAGVAALFGGVNGIMTIVRGVAVPEMLTPNAYGAINGLLVAPSQIAKAAAPAAAAALWSLSDSYAAVMTAIVAAALVLATAFWIASRLTRPAGPGPGPDA